MQWREQKTKIERRSHWREIIYAFIVTYRKIIARQWISNTLNREKESGQVTERSDLLETNF